MTLENVLALIGICIPIVGALAGIAYSLLRGTLTDYEQRLRKVEASAAEGVRRSDLDKLREEFRADLERQSQQLIERLTDPRGVPTPRRRRA